MSNLASGLHEAICKSKELLTMYEEIPAGAFGAVFIRAEIAQAEVALESGDIVEMVKALKALQEQK